MSEIHPDFEDFFDLLNGHSVRYLVIGGVARNAYLSPRLTKDIDVWLQPERANVERFQAALGTFGFDPAQVDIEEMLATSKVLMMGRAPWRIDVLTKTEPLQFESAWKRRVATEYGRIPIDVIAPQDLIASKLHAGRPHDLVDVGELRSWLDVDESDA